MDTPLDESETPPPAQPTVAFDLFLPPHARPPPTFPTLNNMPPLPPAPPAPPAPRAEDPPLQSPFVTQLPSDHPLSIAIAAGNAEVERQLESEDGSSSEHSDSEDDIPQPRWDPIEEDKSEPCEDELAYIASKEEHSALDNSYWESIVYFDPNDPEIVPLQSGTIDWHIDAFNGTKERPNNERIMRSPTVRIGGCDWRIKFFPKGDHSQYPSVYLENVTMQSPDYEEFEDWVKPPFPFLKGQPRVRKRRSMAAQICVVMYNPAEPRVYEYQAEAHQFHKKSADYGWKYFTRYPRIEMHLRQHTQRQAILRDDKLAFRAYIRIVDDPTGCLWEHETQSPDQITAITGLRPFTRNLQCIATAVPMLHFRPFREFVQRLEGRGTVRRFYQSLLLKLYTRRRSKAYGKRGSQHVGDVFEVLWRFNLQFQTEFMHGPEADKLNELVGTMHPDRGTACGQNRLNTKEYPSVQAAVDVHPTLIECPPLLSLELQRQEHDKTDRRWKKLTNRVSIEDRLTVNSVQYTLFAFITHCGHLQSARYNSYVRPRGIKKGWYAYRDGRVSRLTEKQAREKHFGVEENARVKLNNGHDSPFSQFHEPLGEVPCAVMYVRDDIASFTFDAADEEAWVPPNLQQSDSNEPKPSAVHDGVPEARSNIAIEEHIAASDRARSRIDRLQADIDMITEAPTPEPDLDSEGDVVMKDSDNESLYSLQSSDMLEVDSTQGTRDWLGRPYYEGRWMDGKHYHGGGHLIDTNGDEYLGEFRNNKKEGYGKFIEAATGDIYEGQFANDVFHGKGKMVERTTGNVYSGHFKDGRKHGEFVLTGTVTDEDKSCCTICYDKEINTAFYDCGHVVACRDCAVQIDNCPVCRKPVVNRLQLYGVRMMAS